MPQKNMSATKCPMPSLAPDYRNKVFEEVATGYTYDMAIEEARRCLNCKNKPCVSKCPVQIDIPAFIERLANEDIEGAFEIINRSSSLPAVCGRVCPQETQCESKCVRGIKGEPVGIGRLERFVADWHREHAAEAPKAPAQNGHKVAVIGAGPAGLTCAGDLARMGYKVTVYEALHVAGGVLSYGIPEFRLPKAIVNKEVDNLKALGVDVETDRHGHRQGADHRRAVRDGQRGRVHRLRRGPAPVHGHPRREPEGRVFRQRVPDPHQPYEGL